MKIIFKKFLLCLSRLSGEEAVRVLIKLCIIFILFTPLVFFRTWTPLASLWPAVYFRFFVELLVLFYGILLVISPTYIPRWSLLMGGVLIFLGTMAISSIFGFNLARSFWGTAERGEGLLMYIHLVILFFILAGVMRSKEEWRTILRATLGVSLLMGVVAMWQKLGFSGFESMGCTSEQCSRVGSTFGNPSFYGNYLTLLIFIGLFLITLEEKKIWKSSALLVVLMNTILLVMTGSRASWLGTLAGFLFLFVISLVMLSRKMTRLRLHFLLTFLALSGIFLGMVWLRKIGHFQSNPFLQRFDDLVLSIVDPQNDRLLAWRIGLASWKDHHFLGSGLESFMYEYDRLYQPEFRARLDEFTFFDRAHNHLIDKLVTTGLVGVASYLGLIGIVIVVLVKQRVHLGTLGTSSLIAFFIAREAQLFLSFDVGATHLLFFFVLAYVNSRSVDNKTLSSEKKLVRPITIIPLIGLIGIALFFFVVQPLRAYWSADYGSNLLHHNKIEESLSWLKKAEANLPAAEQYELQRLFLVVNKSFQNILTKHGSPQGIQIHLTVIRYDLVSAMSALEEYLDKHPKEAYQMHTYRLLMEFYSVLYGAFQEQTLLDSGLRIIDKAAQLNSLNPTLLKYRAFFLAYAGQQNEAVSQLKKYATYSQDVPQYLFTAGNMYLLKGNSIQKTKGAAMIRRALLLSGFYTAGQFNHKTVADIAATFQQAGVWRELAQFYEDVLKYIPPRVVKYTFYLSLAKTYLHLEDTEKARATVNKAFAQFPEARAKIEEFVRTEKL